MKPNNLRVGVVGLKGVDKRGMRSDRVLVEVEACDTQDISPHHYQVHQPVRSMWHVFVLWNQLHTDTFETSSI